MTKSRPGSPIHTAPTSEADTTGTRLAQGIIHVHESQPDDNTATPVEIDDDVTMDEAIGYLESSAKHDNGQSPKKKERTRTMVETDNTYAQPPTRQARANTIQKSIKRSPELQTIALDASTDAKPEETSGKTHPVTQQLTVAQFFSPRKSKCAIMESSIYQHRYRIAAK